MIGQKRARPPALGGVECFLGARKNLVDIGGMARRDDPADGAGDGDRTCGRHHDVIADHGQKPLGGDADFVRRAILQNDPELVAGKAADDIEAAHATAQALGDDADDLVRDVVSVSPVDAPEIVDRDKQEPAGGLCQCRVAQKLGQLFGQMPAIDFAGQHVEARQIGEFLLALMPIVDRADHAMGPARLAVRTGEPAAGIFDPQLR